MTDIKQLVDEQGRLWEEAKAVNEKHIKENQAFKSDFTSKWERMNNRLDELDEGLKKAVAISKRPQLSEEDANNPVIEYKNLFIEYLQKGRANFAPEKKARMGELAPQCFKADILSLTNAAGGYAVPENLFPEIQRNLLEVSPLRQFARVVNISGNALKVNTATTASAVWEAEGDFPAAGDKYNPTFSQATITPQVLNGWVKVSREAIVDIPNIESFVMGALGDAVAQAEGEAFIKGDGSASYGSITGINQESGLNNKTAASATAVTIDELLDLQLAQTKQQYQGRSVWTFNRSTLQALRQLKDANNQYIWMAGMQAIEGASATLLGNPYFISNDLDNLATGKKPIFFGDFGQACLVVDRLGLTMDRLIEKDYPYIDMILSKRVSFAVIKKEALGHITMA
tara:strand:- start:1922 stop:3121 length:1200 start_codon:yes stop_codon:yes gene_type:complete